MIDATTTTKLRRLIKELDRALDRLYRRVSTSLHLGIGHTELAMLIELYNEDNLQPSKLSARVGYFATSYSVSIDRLEKAGLVQRGKHPADRRKHIITLTEKARALEPELMERIVLHNDELQLDDTQKLKDCIEAIRALRK